MAQTESFSIRELEMDLKNLMGINTAREGHLDPSEQGPSAQSLKKGGNAHPQLPAKQGEAAHSQKMFQQPPPPVFQVAKAHRTGQLPSSDPKKVEISSGSQPAQALSSQTPSVNNPKKKNRIKAKDKNREKPPANCTTGDISPPVKIETLIFSRSDIVDRSLEVTEAVKSLPVQKSCESSKHSGKEKPPSKKEADCQSDVRKERRNDEQKNNWRKGNASGTWQHDSREKRDVSQYAKGPQDSKEKRDATQRDKGQQDFKEKSNYNQPETFRREKREDEHQGPWNKDKRDAGTGLENREISWRNQRVHEKQTNVNTEFKKVPQGSEDTALRTNWRESQVKKPTLQQQVPPAAAVTTSSVAPVEEVVEEETIRLVLFPPTSPSCEKKSRESSKSNSPVEDEDEGEEDSDDVDEEEEKKTLPPAPPEEKKKEINIQPLVMVLPKKQVEWFKQNNILPLKQMNLKFPRAFLHCRLCSFHMSSIAEGKRHASSERHINLQRKDLVRRTLALLPTPSPAMSDVIGSLAADVYDRFSLSPEELEQRRHATERLRIFIETNFPGTSIRSYGSCFTGLGLKTSTVNVGLTKTNPDVATPAGLMIIYVLNALRQSTVWIDLREDLNTRVPVINFRDAQLNVLFSLGFDNENAYKTSCLLQQYLLLDKRFGILVVVFRALARMCQLDQPDLGTIPPHAYSLMTLYYMQQENYLPVLHKQTDAEQEKDSYQTAAEFIEKEPNWKPSELPLGRLWLGLLKFYGHTFSYSDTIICVRSLAKVSRSSKSWGNKRLAIEDPFHQSVNMASPISTASAFDFYLDCIRQAHLYFWTPQVIGVGPLFFFLVPGSESGDLEQRILNVTYAAQKSTEIPAEQLRWIFLPEVFTGGNKLPVNCCVCLRDNHTKFQCPELSVPQVGPIPPPDFAYLAQLDQLCYSIFRNFAPRDVDLGNRELIRRELEQHIQSKERNDAKLTLFGSSCNGFGFADSDLDLCLTFDSNPEGKELDLSAIVKQLAKGLRKNRSFMDIVPVSSAKVPIVKLRHKPTGLESDISLYNRLGQRNSELLATYSKIDSRVRILGFMAKILAKRCEIGDASRGSLSSYGYTLLVLHYLQQVKPPIIPVLQEIQVPGTDRSRYIVEGWDTWFFDDMSNLARVWPHVGANQEPPSVLWLGFLLYYAELFDFRQQVVCIRQLRPLYRLEKMWTDRPIAIEDPFDLNHNLGAGISPRMGAFIRRVFVYARRLFQTPVKRIPPGFSLEGHLFNPNLLIPGGPPPNDRGCRICGKVGHKAKECEFVRKKGNKSNRNVQQHQQSAGQRNNAIASRPAVAGKFGGNDRGKKSDPRNYDSRGPNPPQNVVASQQK